MISATSRKGEFWLYISPLFPAALSIVVFYFPALTQAFQFDRKKVYSYKFYLLITCHFTHWNFRHVLVDTLVLLALSYLCISFSFKKNYSFIRYFIYLLIPSILITTSVFIFNPEITYYRGLSAVDWALYAILMVQFYLARHWLWKAGAVTMLFMFCIILTHQVISKQSMLVGDMGEGIVTMPSAHIAGAIAGAACALIYHIIWGKPRVNGRSPRLRRIAKGREDQA
jgi:membrane associated rhomboid family serine protease